MVSYPVFLFIEYTNALLHVFLQAGAFDCILLSVHDLNRFIDHIQRERGHGFGQDSCGARLIPVLSLSEKKTDKENNRICLTYYEESHSRLSFLSTPERALCSFGEDI